MVRKPLWSVSRQVLLFRGQVAMFSSRGLWFLATNLFILDRITSGEGVAAILVTLLSLSCWNTSWRSCMHRCTRRCLLHSVFVIRWTAWNKSNLMLMVSPKTDVILALSLQQSSMCTVSSLIAPSGPSVRFQPVRKLFLSSVSTLLFVLHHSSLWRGCRTDISAFHLLWGSLCLPLP